jgi:hypothetical protein
MNEELAVFATPNREINICFDYETKPDTKHNIERDISTTGWLLQKQGSQVKVVTLPGPDKGVDDFIVAHGSLAYEKVNYEAMNLKDWQQQQRKPTTPRQPPRKLTPEERQQRLSSKLASENNQTQELNNGYSEQPRPNINIVNPETATLEQLTSAIAEQQKPITDLRLLLKQTIQGLEQSELRPLFMEIARYASCKEFEGKEVNKLFSSVGKADFPLNFQQRMDLVRLSIREDKARIIKKLNTSQDNRQHGFRR